MKFHTIQRSKHLGVRSAHNTQENDTTYKYTESDWHTRCVKSPHFVLFVRLLECFAAQPQRAGTGIWHSWHTLSQRRVCCLLNSAERLSRVCCWSADPKAAGSHYDPYSVAGSDHQRDDAREKARHSEPSYCAGGLLDERLAARNYPPGKGSLVRQAYHLSSWAVFGESERAAAPPYAMLPKT